MKETKSTATEIKPKIKRTKRVSAAIADNTEMLEQIAQLTNANEQKSRQINQLQQFVDKLKNLIIIKELHALDQRVEQHKSAPL